MATLNGLLTNNNIDTKTCLIDLFLGRSCLCHRVVDNTTVKSKLILIASLKSDDSVWPINIQIQLCFSCLIQ